MDIVDLHAQTYLTINDNSVPIQIWSLCSTRYKIMLSFGSFKVLLINTTVKFTPLHTFQKINIKNEEFTGHMLC